VIHHNYSVGAWIFSTTFSVYGLLYLIKHCVFPDKLFDTYVSIIEWTVIFATNFVYLYPGHLMLTGAANNNPSHERIVVSLLLLVFGMITVMCADCQKYFTIQARRMTDSNNKSLITEGMFKWTRNPNYLGEIIALSSF